MIASELPKKIAKFLVPKGLLQPFFQLRKRPITEIFPGIESVRARLSLAHIPEGPDMVMPLRETLVIAAICRWLQPRRVFEIGTYTGTTTLAIAMNSHDNAEIYTLDLPARKKNSDKSDHHVGSAYRGTAADRKIKQLYGNSMAFDFRPYHGKMDLVLVDANHEDQFINADSANAFRMIKPGGVIIWDDYLWDKKYPECAGVTRCLDKLARAHDIANIAGTRLAICRR
jgi:predicted O-methyltransferase YrrM